MAEVAALAGVTKMTVSRVLRHPEKVTPETRDRITAAMTRLGYVPNRLAGSLTAGSSGLVAAIVPTLRHSIFADTLEGISDVLSEAGLGLFVSSSAYRTDVEESQIRSILERRPDALVLTGLTHTGATRELLRGFGIPVVETWETGDEPVDMSVGYSNREAAHAMTAELVRSGYRRIAFVNGPTESNERARHRAEGYQAAMREAGLSAPPIHIASDEAAILPETGAKAIRALRTSEPDVDAVFFTSDVFAVGAILACRELGIDVPRQMGIAGFHDLEIGRVVSPTLTTVHVPAMEMGRKAGHMILARLSGKKVPRDRHDLGFSIISRESSRRPHRANR
jgi:LacI family gluconate utilization system Gnt-I transcriptional repressor